MHVGKPWESAVWAWVCYCFPFICDLLSFLSLTSLCIEYLKNGWVAAGRINCRESVWLNACQRRGIEGRKGIARCKGGDSGWASAIFSLGVFMAQKQWVVGGAGPFHRFLHGNPSSPVSPRGNVICFTHTALQTWDTSFKHNYLFLSPRGSL